MTTCFNRTCRAKFIIKFIIKFVIFIHHCSIVKVKHNDYKSVHALFVQVVGEQNHYMCRTHWVFFYLLQKILERAVSHALLALRAPRRGDNSPPSDESWIRDVSSSCSFLNNTDYFPQVNIELYEI